MVFKRETNRNWPQTTEWQTPVNEQAIYITFRTSHFGPRWHNSCFYLPKTAGRLKTHEYKYDQKSSSNGVAKTSGHKYRDAVEKEEGPTFVKATPIRLGSTILQVSIDVADSKSPQLSGHFIRVRDATCS
jgi:hypothetical protein